MKRTHGMSYTHHYFVWIAMKQRCYNPANRQFKDYSGRGIYVCERWRESFENFMLDMGFRPTSNHTLEREDNNGPYSPDNCKWALRIDQNKNKRNIVLVRYKG
jgi:hypothetical protein